MHFFLASLALVSSVVAEKACGELANFCAAGAHGASCAPSCPLGQDLHFVPNGTIRCFDGFWSAKPCCGTEDFCTKVIVAEPEVKEDSEGTDLSFLAYVIPLALLALFLLALCCLRVCCASKKSQEKDIEAQETEVIAAKPVVEKVASFVPEPIVPAPVFVNKVEDNSHKSVSVVSSEPPQNWSVPIGPNMAVKAPVAPVAPVKPVAAAPVEIRSNIMKRNVPENFGRVVRRSSQSPARKEQAVYVERSVVTAPRCEAAEFANSTVVESQREALFARDNKLALGEVACEDEPLNVNASAERIERVGGFMEVETPVLSAPKLGNLGSRAEEIAPVMV